MNLRHKILGMTLATAAMFGVAAKADTVVPLVTPNTTITLTNATGKTLNGNVEFNQMGIQRGNGTKVPYSINAFSGQTIPSPVTDTNILNSQYATVEPTAGNAEPIVSAFDCDAGNGHNVPTWSLDKINNTQPLAGELRTGQEYLIMATGTQNWSTSCTITDRDENNLYSRTSTATNWVPSSVVISTASGFAGTGLAPNETIEQHFENNGSQGYSAILYTDPATLDTRIEEMRRYTPVQEPGDLAAKAYVQKWLPTNDAKFYLNNEEARAMINGDGKGTPSYAQDMATVLITSSGSGGKTLDQMVHWLKDQVDCNLSNGELDHTYDPLLWNNSNFGSRAFALVEEPSGDVAGFPLDPTNLQTMYGIIRDQFLWRHVMNNPDFYGGAVGGLPNKDHDPTWYASDPNNYVCP